MTIFINEFNRLITSRGFNKFLETDSDIQFECKLDKKFLSELKEECVELGIDFKLIVDRGVDQTYILKDSDSEHIDQVVEMALDDSLRVILDIKKTTLIKGEFSDNFNVIVCSELAWFINKIKDKDLVELEQYLYNGKHIIVGFIMEEEALTKLSNEFITFTSIRDLSTYSSDWQTCFEESIKVNNHIKDTLTKRNENILWNERAVRVTPDFFYLQTDNVYWQSLKDIFIGKFISSAVGFISAVTTFVESEGRYKSVFTGLRNINVIHNFDISKISDDEIQNLRVFYYWIYTGKENITDKIQLVQNIVSMHLDSNSNINDLMQKVKELKISSIENYKSYIENSIEKYLSQRKDLEELIKYTSGEIEKQVNNITSLMVKNLYGIIAASITAVVSIGRIASLDIIPYILYTYSVFIILLTIYFVVFSHINIRLKRGLFENRQKDFLKYYTVERIKEIEGNAIENQMRIYWGFLISTIIINAIISSAAIFVGVYIQNGFNLWNFIIGLF